KNLRLHCLVIIHMFVNYSIGERIKLHTVTLFSVSSLTNLPHIDLHPCNPNFPKHHCSKLSPLNRLKPYLENTMSSISRKSFEFSLLLTHQFSYGYQILVLLITSLLFFFLSSRESRRVH